MALAATSPEPTRVKLPVHQEIPPGLNHRTGLRKLGLQPTGEPVAQYEYRTRKGTTRCDLYDATQTEAFDTKAEYQRRKAREAITPPRRVRREQILQEYAEACRDAEHDALSNCQDDFRKALRTFARWHADPNLLIVDTETTGLDGEVIEIAVATVQGEVLFDSLVRPTVPIEQGATKVHGLTDADLAGAPGWPHVREQLTAVLRGRWLLAFNAAFDRQAIARTSRAHGIDGDPLGEAPFWQCAMTAYAPLGWELRRDQEWRWVGLKDACLQQRVPGEGQIHRARGGALALARLVQALATIPPTVPDTLPEGLIIDDDDIGWTPEQAPGWR